MKQRGWEKGFFRKGFVILEEEGILEFEGRNGKLEKPNRGERREVDESLSFTNPNSAAKLKVLKQIF